MQLPLEDPVAAGSLYSFTVNSETETDRDPSDNSASVTVGYAELQRSVEKISTSDSQIALTTVSNTSSFDTPTYLRVRSGTAYGDVIASYYIGVIGANASETFNIDVTALPALDGEDCTLWFEAIAVEEEIYLPDNYGFIYLSEATPELSVNVTLNGETHPFSSEVTGACSVYAAVYDADGKCCTFHRQTASPLRRMQLSRWQFQICRSTLKSGCFCSIRSLNR